MGYHLADAKQIVHYDSPISLNRTSAPTGRSIVDLARKCVGHLILPLCLCLPTHGYFTLQDF